MFLIIRYTKYSISYRVKIKLLYKAKVIFLSSKKSFYIVQCNDSFISIKNPFFIKQKSISYRAFNLHPNIICKKLNLTLFGKIRKCNKVFLMCDKILNFSLLCDNLRGKKYMKKSPKFPIFRQISSKFCLFLKFDQKN